MKKRVMKAIAFVTICMFSTANMVCAAGASIGIGDISVYKSEKLITKLSGQNPLEDGTLLQCNGKCVIKSEGITLVGTDKAKVAVANEENTFRLFIKQGSVDFIINNNARKIAFHTLNGTYTVADVIFNAGSKSAVKGNVVVDKDGNAEISVSEGRLVFATDDGMKTVDANNRLVLAVKPGAPVDPSLFGLGLWEWLVAIGAVVLVAGVWVWADDNSGDDSGGGGDTIVPVTTGGRDRTPQVPISTSPFN